MLKSGADTGWICDFYQYITNEEVRLAFALLEFMPDGWFLANSFLSAMTGLFFQGSLMLIWGALAFKLPLSQDARTVFVVLCIALQVIIIGWIQRRMMRSYIRKRSEQRNRSQ